MSDPEHDRPDDETAGLPAGAKLPEVEPPPDFLAGVQKKIHRRSGGKFYRSRWSTSPNATLVRILALAMLLAIVLFWLLSGPVQDLGPDTTSPPPTRDGQELRPPVKIRSSGSGSPESPPSPPPR